MKKIADALSFVLALLCLAYIETTAFLQWSLCFGLKWGASLTDFRELALESEIPSKRWQTWNANQFRDFVTANRTS